ncbi:hypothetical protein [Pseudomonas sp. Z2-11]
MKNNSVETLLEWLKEEPRTLGWDAIVAYDRTKTNTVLLQEYIGRFSTSDYMKPITEEIADNATPTQKEFISNYLMDSPRLSFINSNLLDSKAQLSMTVIGGAHLTFEKPLGAQQWNVTKIAQEDALDGPKLLAEIELKATEGTVDGAGTVKLDLAEGTEYRLTYAETEHLRKVAGARFKQRFIGMPEAQRTFVLNEVKFKPDQFLKPSKFFIRTHAKPGANPEDDQGEGAVLLFVTMEGGKNGTYPAESTDLEYLLPEGYSASVLLGHEMVVSKICAEAVKRIHTHEDPFRAVLEQKGNYTEMSCGGGRGSYAHVFSYEGFKFEVVSLIVNFSDDTGGTDNPTPGNASFRLRLLPDGGRGPGTQGGIDIEWRGDKEQPCKTDGLGFLYNITSGWMGVWVFNFIMEGPGVVGVKKGDTLVNAGVGIGYYEGDDRVEAHFNDIRSKTNERLLGHLDSIVEEFSAAAADINVFSLNSLLFRGDNAVRFERVDCTGDLALFGQVGPTQTAFSIVPLEPVISHTTDYPFTTEPPREGLTWTVENILGSTAYPGAFKDPASGFYTPPTVAEIEGNQTRVKVTATDGIHTSSALVSVLPRPLSVNPLIQICGAADSLGREMSAGALNGDGLEWSVEDPSSGATVRPSDKEEGDHTYYPGPQNKERLFSVDNIVVKNTRTGITEKAKVLVLHGVPSITVRFDESAALQSDQVQLKAYWGNDEPVDPTEELKWALLEGSGQVNPATGVYTIDPEGQHRFAVVTAYVPPLRGRPADEGFILLPVPLFSVPETIRMLSTDSQ